MRGFKCGDRVRVRIGMNVVREKGTVIKVWHWNPANEPGSTIYSVLLDAEPDHPRNLGADDMEHVSIVEQVGEIQS